MTPLVYIVILNWNGRDDTLECLESIGKLDYPTYKVVVVDNGSTDGSVERIKKEFFSIGIMENNANLGFAEGNNVGIRHALSNGADYILLLNNDTTVAPDILEAFVESAKQHPEGGIFAAKIYYFAEPDKLWYAGAQWMDEGLYFQHTGIGTVDNGGKYQHVAETAYASGCALFIGASLITKIGLMDPKFFLTYEETDWCYRARAAGHKCLFVPTAQVWHKVSASFGGVESPLQLYFYARNILLWGERHLSRADYWKLFRKTFQDVMPFSIGNHHSRGILKPLFWTISSVLKRIKSSGNDPIARAKYLGFRDYLLRRFGDCPQEIRSLKVRR